MPRRGRAAAEYLDQKFGDAAEQIPVYGSEFGWNRRVRGPTR
ncbi:hypothetical protein [Streptomyces johnsoniae]|uniref:Uncharacterized protein n=1 Tax=Streptomyces johnsoniae TaxID=3075532 RepID=A0ABU2S5U6_9ACTN|nr:hypothetical protein [Streptomyces sp. DSM 41886]MDT0444198.1 hypothetical protein [Streptomyces sp. DSM 41886]